MSPKRHPLTILVLAAGLAYATGCGPPGEQSASTLPDASAARDSTVQYDSLLAGRLGADEYGMKRYVIAFLKAGANRGQDSARAAELQRAHLENIQRMAENGDLVLAGPFLDDGEIRGIYVFDVESVDEARALTASDPAVQAGRLEMELHPWYGSAALGQVNEIHASITRQEP